MAENRDGTECQIYFRMPRIDPLWQTQAVFSLATVSFRPSQHVSCSYSSVTCRSVDPIADFFLLPVGYRPNDLTRR